MKYCHQCGTANHEQAMFCKQCGVKIRIQKNVIQIPVQQEPPVAVTGKVQEKKETPTEPTPVQAPTAEPSVETQPLRAQKLPQEKPVKKSKKGLVIGIAVGAVLLIGAATAGIFYWQSTRGDSSDSVEGAANAGDDDLTAALRGRIETARSGFADGTMDYTAFMAELDSIEALDVAEVANELADARQYADQLRASHEAFAAAEALFGEGKYLEASEQYALVTQEDNHYETALSKGAECLSKYRENVLAEAAGCGERGDYAGAVALLEAALENLPGDAVLQEQLAVYSECHHVYEDGKCKNCGTVDEGYEGLMKAADGSWYYARGGKMDTTFTGLCQRNGFFYYVKAGKLDWSFTGLAKHKDTWYYMMKGELANTFTGLVEHSTTKFYVKNGKVDTTFTGLYKQAEIWYYIEKGEHKRAYTGICRHGDAWYYVSNGKLDRSYSGIYRKDGITYTIQNGVVQ